MPLAQPDSFLSKLRTALETTDNRGILLTGNSGIELESDDVILAVKAAPHSRLLPRVKGVIHHGGVGTMAAALRAGKPQVIMPFSVDQPFWAKRLHQLGYSLKPMRERDATAATLAEAFREMDDPNAIRRAEEIAEIIRNENAAAKTVEYLSTMVEQSR
ncbi:MAG: hypothetical protein GX562_01560 [Coriobacteriaceae bacterium]|nr:hypothetical protein [Coriobacteriaceae bacterium]